MTAHEVLRRLLDRSGPAQPDTPGEVTPARVFRTSVARAADVDCAIGLTVTGLADERQSLEASVDRVDEASLIYALTRANETVGFATIDAETRSVIVEKQMTGALRDAPGPERAFSASDVELCRPLIDGAIREIRCMAEAPPLAGWANGVSTGPRITEVRSIGLALDEGSYRFVDLSLDFGVGGRAGRLILCLPFARSKPGADVRSRAHGEAFERQFREALLDAPAALHAVLHRMKVPLRQIESFAPGDVVPLPGITVNSVRLEGPGGEGIAAARLGQVTGLRAVRLELAAPRELKEAPLVEPPKTRVPGQRAAEPGAGNVRGAIQQSPEPPQELTP